MLNECPIKNKELEPLGQDVTITKQEMIRTPSQNLLQRLLTIFFKLKNSYSLRNSIKIYEYLNSLAAAGKSNGQFNDLYVVPTIASNFYCVTNPNFIKTILKYPRLEHGDILSEGRQLLVIAEALGRMRLNTEKSEMKDKRNVLATLLVKPERYLTKMLEISENLVKRWQDNIGSPFSITDDIAIFTVEIFARTILNYSGPCAPIVQILEKQIMLLGQKLSYRRVTSFQKKFKLLRDELSKLLTANGIKIAENTQYQERLTEYIDKRHKEQAEEAFIIGVNGAALAGYLAPNPAFNAVIYELGRYPEWQDKIFQEYKEFCSSKDMSVNDYIVAENTILNAVIHEALRIHPPQPFLFRNVTDDFTINQKYHIPKNSQLVIDLYHSLKDKRWWGGNADSFDPMRFISNTQLYKMPVFVYSTGPNNCTGQYYSRQELKTLIYCLCQNFRWETMNSVKHKFHFALTFDNHIKIKLFKRN